MAPEYLQRPVTTGYKVTVNASTVTVSAGGICTACGAQLFPGDPWCAHCLAPIPPGEADAKPSWTLADLLPVLLAGLGLGSLVLLVLTEWFGMSEEVVLAYTILLPGIGLTVSTLYWLRYIRHVSWRSFGWPRSPWRDIGLGFGAGLLSMGIVALIAQAMFRLVNPDEVLLDLPKPTAPELIAFGLALVLVAPIGEEIFFRGFLYGGLRRRFRAVPSALISAGVFAALHVPLWRTPAIFVFGLVLAALYERRRNLVVCIAAHAINNFVVLIIILASGILN